MSIAKGASDLLIAMKTPSENGLGIPAILHGKPGTGKTSFVESLATADMPVLTLICSLYEATDFSGLPFFCEGRTKFAPPDWAFFFDEFQNGILFFDELTTCMPQVQAALLRVILNRTVGTKRLPKNVRIVSAANPADGLQGSSDLSAPLANRFLHIPWELSTTEFVRGFTDGFESAKLMDFDLDEHEKAKQRWRGLIAAFLQLNNAALNTVAAPGELAFASPRSYDMAASLLASCELLGISPPVGKSNQSQPDDGTAARLAIGTLGSGAATAFLGFLQNLDLPDPSKFLSGKIKVDPGKLQDDELFVFFNSLASLLELRTKANGDVKQAKETTRVLSLISDISKCGKLDCVFVCVKRLIDSNWLQNGIMCCYRIDDKAVVGEFERAMQSLESTDLISYLATIQGSSRSA